MAASFRSLNGIAYATHTNPVIPAPTGVQNGDCIILWCSVGGSGGQIVCSAPAGFTSLNGFPYLVTNQGYTVSNYCWYRLASGEPSTYTLSHFNAYSELFVAAISGCDPGAVPTVTQNQGTASTTTALSITASNVGSEVLFVSQDWDDQSTTLSPPAGSTPTFAAQWRGSLVMCASGTMSTAGATGNKSITNNNTNGLNSAWSGYLVEIDASASGGQPAPVSTLMLIGYGY